MKPSKETNDTSLLTTSRDSEVGRRTSTRKLNGIFYTPARIARVMLDMVRWPDPSRDYRLLDPACGDGAFLEAAMRKLSAEGLPVDEKVRLVKEMLVGWDVDAGAVDACKQRLYGLSRELGLKGATPVIEHRNALSCDWRKESFDCVVGNPPYLEAKRMPDQLKGLVRSRFALAGFGAFDLYAAFVELAYRLVLRTRGELCLILPNRFLVASFAERLRNELIHRAEVSVFDLSRQRVFEDAAVYPVVMHARVMDESGGSTTLSKSGQDARRHGRSRGLELISVSRRVNHVIPVSPDTRSGIRLLERLFSARDMPSLGDLADVRWTVSFHKAGVRDGFVYNGRPGASTGTMRRFLGGGRYSGNREVKAFKIEWAGWWIDYDRTRARKAGASLPPLELFESPKLVVCQNARRARAAVDREGFVLKDTLLAVLPRSGTPGYILEWLALVLNSDVFHYLYEHVYGGTRKGGRYLHFLPRYLAPMPIPIVNDQVAITRLHDYLSAGGDLWLEAEDIVRRGYQLTRSELKALSDYEFPKH